MHKIREFNEGMRQKLPKSAQNYISELESCIHILQQSLDAATGKVDGDTRVSMQVGMSDIPVADETYAFRLCKHGRIRVMLRNENGETVLDINGDDAIMIQPRAANAAWITLRGRKDAPSV